MNTAFRILTFAALFFSAPACMAWESVADKAAHKGDYVDCTARFVAYKKDFPWHEHVDDSWFHGTAPRASFVVTYPKQYAGHEVHILFKYENKTDKAVLKLLRKSDDSTQFTFALPRDFFDKKAHTIDSLQALRISRIFP